MMIATILRELAQTESVTANQDGNYKTALVNSFTTSIHRSVNTAWLNLTKKC